jgi:uncharacterized protein YpmB
MKKNNDFWLILVLVIIAILIIIAFVGMFWAVMKQYQILELQYQVVEILKNSTTLMR